MDDLVTSQLRLFGLKLTQIRCSMIESLFALSVRIRFQLELPCLGAFSPAKRENKPELVFTVSSFSGSIPVPNKVNACGSQSTIFLLSSIVVVNSMFLLSTRRDDPASLIYVKLIRSPISAILKIGCSISVPLCKTGVKNVTFCVPGYGSDGRPSSRLARLCQVTPLASSKCIRIRVGPLFGVLLVQADAE